MSIPLKLYEPLRYGYNHARNQERFIHMDNGEEPQLSGDKSAEELDTHLNLEERLTK